MEGGSEEELLACSLARWESQENPSHERTSEADMENAKQRAQARKRKQESQEGVAGRSRRKESQEGVAGRNRRHQSQAGIAMSKAVANAEVAMHIVHNFIIP